MGEVMEVVMAVVMAAVVVLLMATHMEAAAAVVVAQRSSSRSSWKMDPPMAVTEAVAAEAAKAMAMVMPAVTNTVPITANRCSR